MTNRDDVKRFEAAIDAAWEATPLPADRSDRSKYYTLLTAEEAPRVNLAGERPLIASAKHLPSLPYALRQALDLIQKKQPAHALPRSRGALSNSALQKADRFLAQARSYQAAVSALSNYWNDLATCEVAQDGQSANFQPTFDLGNVIIEDLPTVEEVTPFEAVWQWIPRAHESEVLQEMSKNCRRSGEWGVAYDYDSALADDLHAALPSAPPIIPDPWVSSLGSAKELRDVLAALQTRCLYHLLSNILGAKRVLAKGFGIETSLLDVSIASLVQEVADIAGRGVDVTHKIIRALVLGYKTTSPDPALQPLIPVRQGDVIVPPILVANSNVERNALTLLARVDAAQFHQQSKHFEDRMTTELDALFRRLGYSTRVRYSIPRAADAGDVDLLVFDPRSREILALELRWTIQPGDPKEILDRRRMVGCKVDQAVRKHAAISANIGEVARSLDAGTSPQPPTYAVKTAVVIEGFGGHDERRVAGCPVLERHMLEAGLGGTGSLHELWAWAQQGHGRPERDRHYRSASRSYSIGDVQFTWAAIERLPALDTFVQTAVDGRRRLREKLQAAQPL